MIPNDPVMLLSFVNTQLRDNYSTLNEFCAVYGISQSDIISKLKSIDYSYSGEANQFV